MGPFCHDSNGRSRTSQEIDCMGMGFGGKWVSFTHTEASDYPRDCTAFHTKGTIRPYGQSQGATMAPVKVEVGNNNKEIKTG